MSDVDSAHFRQLLGRFATGVTVITAHNAAGTPVGMTANTLASVSLIPPLISVCIDHSADMHRTLGQASEFTINILASNQEAISRRFAEEGTRRFEGIGFSRSQRGGIILDGVLAHLECERVAEHPAGDHSIYVGRVVGGKTSDGEPLLYYRGGYAGMARG
jgi:flavin reductase (DIM6/NTAB) family NADH-FMN oxidoreductase RutF